MAEWLLPTLTFLGGCAATYMLLRIRFERFEAMDTRREKDWSAWREDVDERLHGLNGSLLEKLRRLEADFGTHDTGLRGQVHKISNFADSLDKRVYFLERIQSGAKA